MKWWWFPAIASATTTSTTTTTTTTTTAVVHPFAQNQVTQAYSTAAKNAWKRLVDRIPFRRPQTLSLDEVKSVGERYLAVLDDDTAWERIAEEKGVTVHKLRKGKVAFVDADDDRWACLKSTAVLPCDAKWLTNLLLDSAAAVRYNCFSAGRTDVEVIDGQTKIVWNKSKISSAASKVMKPFDSCNVMHAYERPRPAVGGWPAGNDVVVLTRHVQHPAAPVSATYGRCEHIIGLQVLRPPAPDGPTTEKTTKGKKRNKSSTTILSVGHMRYPYPPYFVAGKVKRATLNYLQGLLAYCSSAEVQRQQPRGR